MDAEGLCKLRPVELELAAYGHNPVSRPFIDKLAAMASSSARDGA